MRPPVDADDGRSKDRGTAHGAHYVKTLHGHQRHGQLVSLRSLLAWAKRNGLIFRNPSSRIKVGKYEYAVLQPLIPGQVDRSVAAATTPATRLILARYADSARALLEQTAEQIPESRQ
ncbi:hypothetical protein AB0L50_20550 [Streptomyces flaveolus]|uniref:hypothetical protein n=1 Tax=Streptomyces flaveolus TaxID=67297 RepID=UPI003445A84C